MKKLYLPCFTILLLTFGQANASLVSFSSTGNSAFTYSGVDFSDSQKDIDIYPINGYLSVGTATTNDYVAYNPYEVSPSTFTWNSLGTFDLNSFVIAGAWGSQTLNIAGYNGASLVNSANYFVNTTASTFTANWSALTHFVITTGNDHIDFGLGGIGQHWALNNISVNENLNAVPLPAALFMFAPALLGFMGFRRKAKNLAA